MKKFSRSLKAAQAIPGVRYALHEHQHEEYVPRHSPTPIEISSPIIFTGPVSGSGLAGSPTFADLAERDAYPAGQRYAGLICYVESEAESYQLKGGIENSNWEVMGSGSSFTVTGYMETLLDDGDAESARATLGVDPAGTDNSTDVTLTGVFNYLSITGQEITLNPIDLTGDVTNRLAFSNMAEIPTDSFVGRYDPGIGTMQTLSAAQATSLLITFTDSAKGLVPPSAGGSVNFLRADGVWAAPPSTSFASIAEVNAGTETDKAISPAVLAGSIIDGGTF